MALAIKEAMQRIEQGVDEFFQSDRFREYLDFISSFHQYSYRNTLLIKSQLPNATLVAGYKKWQEMGRQVRRGEHGLTITAMSGRIFETDTGEKDVDGNSILEKNRSSVFFPVTVFDISQTEGRDMPRLVENLTGDVPFYNNIAQAIQSMTDYRIVTSPFDEMGLETVNGICDHEIRTIFIREGMSQAQTFKTMVHELFHSRNHAGSGETRAQKEIEAVAAVAAAYVVCSHFGLDTSDYRLGYVAGFAAGTDHETKRRCIKSIFNDSKEIITGIEGAMGITRDANGFIIKQAEEKLAGTVSDILPEAENVNVRIYSRLPAEEKTCYVHMTNEYYNYSGAMKVAGLGKEEVISLLSRLIQENAAGSEPVAPNDYLTRYGGMCEPADANEEHDYVLSYDLGNNRMQILSSDAAERVSALVEYEGETNENEAFARLNDKETIALGVYTNLNPIKAEPIREPFIQRLDKYEQLGYDQSWPMVDITYTNIDNQVRPAMNISDAVKFVEKLEDGTFNRESYMKIRIKYTYNDWQYEHVQDLNFGKGRLNFIDYLNLPNNIINHLKSHAALIDLSNKAARYAPDTSYGRDYVDRMLEWSTFCRMELNHNSDAPVLPEHPLINDNVQSDVLAMEEK
ncbi:MAG: ArdC family protein [Clostridium sp.]|nr:ArdC family protein [Clostridium sp.]